MDNPVGWFEIYVQDMSRARLFYEKVFGSEFRQIDSPGMDMLGFPMKDGSGATGALVRMPGMKSGGNSVIVYFVCQDCAVEAAKAASSGGSVFKEKTSIGPYGFIALTLDSEGNTIGLHSMK